MAAELPTMIFGVAMPFAGLCGIEPDGLADGRARLRLVLGPQHCNSHGFAHGGVLCTLLDVAMSTVARLTTGSPMLTLDLQTRFLAPGRGVLFAEARVVKAGRTIVFCDGEVCDAGGDVVASASGLFKPGSAAKPGGGQAPAS